MSCLTVNYVMLGTVLHIAFSGHACAVRCISSAFMRFMFCRMNQTEIANLVDWNKNSLAEHYAKHKDLKSILAMQGFPQDVHKHALTRAMYNPPKPLVQAVWAKCFQVDDELINLEEFETALDEVHQQTAKHDAWLLYIVFKMMCFRLYMTNVKLPPTPVIVSCQNFAPLVRNPTPSCVGHGSKCHW